MSKESTSSGGIGFFGLLTVLFVGLKLTGYVTWSWWWVTAPLWGGLALLFIGFVCIILFTLVVSGIAALFMWWKERE